VEGSGVRRGSGLDGTFGRWCLDVEGGGVRGGCGTPGRGFAVERVCLLGVGGGFLSFNVEQRARARLFRMVVEV
jgi:hypothetical protein